MAFTATAATYPIAEDPFADLRVNGSDYFVNVGFGLIAGSSRVTAFGNNPDVDTTGLPEDCWSGGGMYNWISTPAPLEIVSSSADDTALGTGARSVLISGLDVDYVQFSEVVTLNGTTAVPLTRTYLRINGARVIDSGSGQTNAGMITIRDVTGGTVRALLQTGYAVSRQSQYTVPAGCQLQIVSFLVTGLHLNGQPQYLTAALAVKLDGTNTWFQSAEVGVFDSPFQYMSRPGVLIPEKSDVSIRVTQVGADNMSITCGWEAILRRYEKRPV